MSGEKTLNFLGDYIGGKWILTDRPDEEWNVPSPSNLKDIVIRPVAKFDNANRAVEAARAAYLPWAHLGTEKRKQYLLRLKEVFVARGAELTEIIARETGKP